MGYSGYIGLQRIHWVSWLWSPLMQSREGSASKCSTHRECSGMIGYLFDSMREKKRRVVVVNIAQFGCSWNHQPMPPYSLFHGYHLSPIAHFVCGWTHFEVTITSREISNWQQKSSWWKVSYLSSFLPSYRQRSSRRCYCIAASSQICNAHSNAMHWMYNRCWSSLISQQIIRCRWESLTRTLSRCYSVTKMVPCHSYQCYTVTNVRLETIYSVTFPLVAL